MKQTLDRPTKVEVLTLKTDDVENTGVSLAKNGAVFLGLTPSTTKKTSIYCRDSSFSSPKKSD